MIPNIKDFLLERRVTSFRPPITDFQLEQLLISYGILVANESAKEAGKLAYPGTEVMTEVAVGLTIKKQIK